MDIDKIIQTYELMVINKSGDLIINKKVLETIINDLLQPPPKPVVKWLPFIMDNQDKFNELSKKKKLLKKFDDGSIVKQGDEEPSAICTHFAEQPE